MEGTPRGSFAYYLPTYYHACQIMRSNPFFSFLLGVFYGALKWLCHCCVLPGKLGFSGNNCSTVTYQKYFSLWIETNNLDNFLLKTQTSV